MQCFDYFVDQRLQNPDLPEELWNCIGKRHRSNNIVEGWNQIELCRRERNPSILHVTDILKSESIESSTNISAVT